MLGKLILAAMTLAFATPSMSQVANKTCTKDQFGDFCTWGPGPKQLTDQDYGMVYVSIQPPAGISEQVIKANGKGWKKWLKRFLIPGAKSGSIVAEIYSGDEKLAAIPVALFSVDEKMGLKVETQLKLQTSTPATAFFKLDGLTSNPVKVTFTVRSGTVQSSNIMTQVGFATKLAEKAGVEGYLFSAAANPLLSGLQTVESAIANNFNATNSSKVEVAISFETAGVIDYVFGLDPSGADRTGQVTFQLVRASSLFGTQGAKDNLPLFNWGTRYDPPIRDRILSRTPTGKAVQTHLDEKMLNQFAQLKSADISPANFENSCQTLSAAADTLGLTPNDKTVVMWASFLTGNNMRRDEIRKTLCVSSWSQSFEILGLVLPPVIAPPSLPVNNAELSETRLRSLMASYFSVLGKETDQELKTLALMALLLDRPKPDFNIDPDFGLALMDESASPRELAEKLAGLTFRAGCFFRAADKTVHYLIRKLSAGSENGEHLWVGDARLVSALSPATIDSTKLTELRFKNATANDLVEFAQNFPERQGCSNVSTAPTIN